MDMMNLPQVWRTPAGMSQSPAQYAQSQGRNWSQTVNDRNAMAGYYGNMQSGPDYSGGRYVPPTFSYGFGNSGQIDPSRMMWNEQRNYYTPEQNYRFPTMPNFGMMEGIGNYGMNPFQQMMQMQQMGWLAGGRGGPWSGGGMDYSGGAAELFRRGGGGGRPQMPRFGGGMFSPYFGYGGLEGWFGPGQSVPGLDNQAGLKPSTLPATGPAAPGGG
jgi:hypothetical protein